MKVILETGSTGIHNYIEVTIEDPKASDIDVIKKILVLVDKYNKDQVDNA